MSKRLLEKHVSANNLVDRWITVLKADGFSLDDMLLIFKLAKRKADFIIEQEKNE